MGNIEKPTAKYAQSYSDESFWKKVGKVFKRAGREVIENALILWYVLQSPDTPLHNKALIIAALGYFISPLDMIPDVTPIVGYADDVGAIALVIHAVGANITPDIRARAKAKADSFFGTDN